MGRIIEIPFSKNLIEYIAEELIKEELYDFSSIIVVFPHHRPSLYLRQMMAERLNHPFFPPSIYSIDDFMAFLAEVGNRSLITPIDSVYLLYQAVRMIKEGPWHIKSFNQFLFWGLSLTQAIGELDIELVSNDKLKGIKIEAPWEEITQEARIFIKNLSEIRGIYHRLLEEYNATTREMIYASAAKGIEGKDLSQFRSIYLVGLFAMTFSEKRVLRHLLRMPNVKLVRQNDGLRYTPFEEMDSWAKVEYKACKEGQRPKIILHSAFNIHSQVVGLRDELLRSCNYEDTAIVLPEPDLLIPILSEVMTRLDTDYNITMGYPLERTPIFGLLDLIIRLKKSKRENTYYLPDYLSLIMHPYIKNISKRIESTKMRILIHSIEEELTKAYRMFIELTEIEGMESIFKKAVSMIEDKVEIKDLKDAIVNIHDTFIRKLDGITSLSGFISSLEGILKDLIRFSQAHYYPFSAEFFHGFSSFLERLKDSLIKDERFKEPEDLFDLFSHLIRQEHIPFTGIPLKGLQILGLLETRALSFKRVFLLSANEGVIPGVLPFDPLLPLPLREVLGLPLYYHKEEIYLYHFRHLVFAAEEVHIFYKELKDESRSRFIEGLVWEEEKRTRRLKVLEARPIKLSISLRPLVRFKVVKSKEIFDLLYRMSFTPSILNTYLNCPAQFYFENLLGLREKERLEFNSRNIGTILHKVMERLYKPFIGKPVLDKSDYLTIERGLASIVEDVFIKEFKKINGEHYLLKEMILWHLSDYIKEEKDLFAGRIRILSTEQDLACRITLDDGRPVLLKGRVDRIDKIKEEYIIIDYKSGGDLKRYYFNPSLKVYSSRDEMKEEIRNLQLPFYLLLYQKAYNISANSINPKLVSLKTREERFLFNGEINREEFLEEAFLPMIKRFICEILDPNIPFVADNRGKVCDYCPFPVLCRSKT